MKFFISQILLFLTLISIIFFSQCEDEYKKFRLSHLLNRINELKNEKSGNKIRQEFAIDMDFDCLKNFLNLPQNVKMIIKEHENIVITLASIFKCSANAGKTVFDAIGIPIDKSLKKHLNCFEWHLKQLEPESQLLENVIVGPVESDECKEELHVQDMVEILNKFEKSLGPLVVFSCGAVSGINDFVKFISKKVLIEYGERNEDIKKAEKQKLEDYLKNILLTTADCIIKRFEADPKEYLKNDTLDYYVSNALTFTNSYDSEYEKNYNEKLKKLVDFINIDCTKEKLNLLEIGDLTLLKEEATVLISSAMSKCIKVDQFDFSNFFLDFAVEEDQRSEEYVYCTKVNLQKLDPSSKLAKISQSQPEYDRDCVSYSRPPIYPYRHTLYRLERSFGSLNGTCFETAEKIENLISTKMILLASENNEELKKTEIKEIFATVTEKLDDLANCVFRNVR